jgi:hypothetical protein
MDGFLQSVLGPEGSATLHRVTANQPLMKALVLPWAARHWLERVGAWHGDLPGKPGVRLELVKSQDRLSGHLSFGASRVDFHKAPVEEVAAALALLDENGADNQRLLKSTPPDPRGLALLGKAIGALVEIALKKTELPGLAAQPAAPQQAIPAQGQKKAPKNVTPGKPQMPKPLDPNNLRGPQRGVQPVQKSAMREVSDEEIEAWVRGPATVHLSKSEIASRCPVCGEREFQDEHFTGCYCTRELAKSGDWSLVRTATGYRFRFGATWELSDIQIVLGNLRGK